MCATLLLRSVGISNNELMAVRRVLRSLDVRLKFVKDFPMNVGAFRCFTNRFFGAVQ